MAPACRNTRGFEENYVHNIIRATFLFDRSPFPEVQNEWMVTRAEAELNDKFKVSLLVRFSLVFWL